MTVLERFPHRLTLVTGHYGTGKTEFSVNLALALAEAGERTALAEEVSRLTGIPVACHAAEARFLEALKDLDPFPMESRMKKPWE